MTRISAAAFLVSLVLQAGAADYRIETFAGTDFSGDGGSALSALLVQPQTPTFDRAGNLYFADSGDHRVRRVDPDGTIHTIAGTGVAGYRGDGGAAVKAQLRSPYGVAVDWSGNVYVADLGNAVVRRISPDGVITTVAGGGEVDLRGRLSEDARLVKLVEPRDLAVDQMGNLYISDFGGHRVYQLMRSGALKVLAGTGQRGVPTEFGLAVDSPLDYPAGIHVDLAGNVYVADFTNHRVRCLRGGILTSLAYNEGRYNHFAAPTSIAIDLLGKIYVANAEGHVIVVKPDGKLEEPPYEGTGIAVSPMGELFAALPRQVVRYGNGTKETVAGAKSMAAGGDGQPRDEWRFNAPSGLARDAEGNIYIADTGNGRVRSISPAGMLSTVTTQIAAPVALAFDSQGRLHVADQATRGIYRMVDGRMSLLADGGANRRLQPSAIAFDSQDRLYVADPGSDLIRRLNPDGALVVVAGGGSEPEDGPALRVRVSKPAGLAIDENDDVWFTEADTGRLRKLTREGRVETVALTGLLQAHALRWDLYGNFLITDLAGHRVLRFFPDGGWEPVAGFGDKGFSGDGEDALTAMLDGPADVLQQEDGSILIADSGNNRLRILIPETVEPPAVTLPELVVIHAATGKEQAVAPGQVVFVQAGRVSLEGAQILFGGFNALILASTPDVLTVQVPAGVQPGVVEVQAAAAEALLASADVEIAASAPGILTVGNSGQAAVLNEDGQPNSGNNPARPGSIIAVYLTGAPGNVTLLGADVGQEAAEVVWAGPAPELPGLFQINIRIPAGAAGVQTLTATIDGVATQPGVTVTIQ